MSETALQINEYLDYLFVYGPVFVYAALFIACFIENIFPPFPGDTFILVAGGLVAVGRLELWLSFLLILAGGLGSTMCLYFIGSRFGRDFFLKRNYRYLPTSDIFKAEDYLHRRGALVLIGSRFVVGFRVAIALVAGIGNYGYIKTLCYSAVSYCLFGGILMFLGFGLIENLDRIETYFRTYNTVVLLLVASIIIAYVVHRFMRIRKENG